VKSGKDEFLKRGGEGAERGRTGLLREMSNKIVDGQSRTTRKKGAEKGECVPSDDKMSILK